MTRIEQEPMYRQINFYPILLLIKTSKYRPSAKNPLEIKLNENKNIIINYST